MSPTKFEWNPMTLVRVTSDFQLKEHLYTFELPPKRDPSDWVHIHRDKSAHTRHAPHQFSSKSITIRPSYTRFYVHPKNMNFFTPSDWAHFHRVAPAHTRHAPLQISSSSNAIRQSYTRLQLKEHLSTFESAKFQISLIFTGQHRGTPPMPAHQVPSKSNTTRPSYTRFIKWKGEWTPLATEKGGWRVRVTVSHLKIATNTHFFAFFSPPQGAREVRPCAPTRACPPPHVLPPRLSWTTQPSWAPRHSLCWRWHFSQPLQTPCGAPPAAVLAAAIFWIFVWCTR